MFLCLRVHCSERGTTMMIKSCPYCTSILEPDEKYPKLLEQCSNKKCKRVWHILLIYDPHNIDKGLWSNEKGEQNDNLK